MSRVDIFIYTYIHCELEETDPEYSMFILFAVKVPLCQLGGGGRSLVNKFSRFLAIRAVLEWIYLTEVNLCKVKGLGGGCSFEEVG